MDVKLQRAIEFVERWATKIQLMDMSQSKDQVSEWSRRSSNFDEYKILRFAKSASRVISKPLLHRNMKNSECKFSSIIQQWR